ncbi:MAG: type II toxin-antitoxin system RelE/ParE family toxin [Mesorhizobium sp.]|uniref:type II toxin-antitoxin system RelE/ParE family toxin n=1 Tax=Mesorhizobium sp. TaxID=1871066 RepID=UPI0011F86941|nr:type II toxin-antitoxin system RelE/ParE family toxin [Mesorhizobium sp.]TIQ34394.1 MAG: type II toxin-antitoxin system RelE/ParE family toxin [Mesorhizobium sp.]
MIEVRQTADFTKWLGGLRDTAARMRIVARIRRVEIGNIGDAKYFDGIGELRIDHGPGYRIYFAKVGNAVIILLCGGDKSSQKRDIVKAKLMAKEI